MDVQKIQKPVILAHNS